MWGGGSEAGVVGWGVVVGCVGVGGSEVGVVVGWG